MVKMHLKLPRNDHDNIAQPTKDNEGRGRERRERVTIPSYSSWFKNIRKNMQIKFEAGHCLT